MGGCFSKTQNSKSKESSTIEGHNDRKKSYGVKEGGIIEEGERQEVQYEDEDNSAKHNPQTNDVFAG